MENTLQESWNDFQRQAYPEGMTEDQRKQIHTAFFAGSLSAMLLVAEAANKSEADGATMISKMLKESIAVANNIIQVNNARN